MRTREKLLVGCPRPYDVVMVAGLGWEVVTVFPIIGPDDRDGFQFLIERNGEAAWITMWDDDESVEVLR